MPIGRYAEENNNIFNNADDSCADNSAQRTADAACRRHAANDRSSDGRHDPYLANRRLRRSEPRHHEHAGQSAEKAGDNETNSADAVDADAENSGSFQIVADSIHVAAEHGQRSDKSYSDKDGDKDDERHRHAPDIAFAKKMYFLRNVDDSLAFGNDQVDAFVDAGHAKRDDQGIEPDLRHKQTVHQAAEHAEKKRQRKRDKRIDADIDHENAADNAAQAGDSANGKVELSQYQQQSLAQGDNADESQCSDNDYDVVGSEKVFGIVGCYR